MTSSSPPPPDVNANPADLDISCPLCEYNLRGLSEPRCPECGYKFVWAELVEATRSAHPYLFEVQRRKAWSFWKTLVGGLRPGRFWKTLKPAHRGNLRRLFLYWLITLLIGFAAAAAMDRVVLASLSTPLSGYMVRAYSYSLGSPLLYAYSSRDSVHFGFSFYRLNLQVGDVAVIYAGAILIWTAATFLALLIFQQSMARAKIRTHHLFRCVIYSADVVIWASLFGMAALAAYAALVFSGGQGFSVLEVYLCTCAAIIIVFCIRLCVALRLYLQMDRPFWTVMATQVLVALAIVTALVVASVA
ncbi:MAG TPA: hypothetical protein VFW23_16455 [Tepidisphaeraceae bacterium]|nr:hypothetical protein [Tepidisphaeraceae bacterium]